MLAPPNRHQRRTAAHCRCTSKACGKRFKGAPGVTRCPSCARVGRLDRWADAKPWRARVCHCGAYHFPHRFGGAACCGPRVFPELPGVAGLPF